MHAGDGQGRGRGGQAQLHKHSLCPTTESVDNTCTMAATVSCLRVVALLLPGRMDTAAQPHLFRPRAACRIGEPHRNGSPQGRLLRA